MSEVLLKEDNLVDLSSMDASENFLFEITNLIENKNLHGKSIRIDFGNAIFDQSQMENVISVLKGFNIDVEMIFSGSKETKIAAIETGLTVSGKNLHKDISGDESSEEEESTEENKLENILLQETVSKAEKKDTLYVKQTLRSGQKLEYDGNLVIIGDCNAGSEVIASGDIMIWGILSGIAHAGNKGDLKACIRAFKINAIQLRIADLLARKPDTFDLDKVERSDLFNPEEAKVSDGEIVIYSLQQETH